MIEAAKLVARLAHGDQQYSEHPYLYHLEKVVAILQHYDYAEFSLAAGYLHDVLEDTTVVTYADLSTAFGKDVADTVESCTGRGPNRKARQADIHRKLVVYTSGRHVKLADRMANLHEALLHGKTGFVEMYTRESPRFEVLIRTYVKAEQREDYLRMVKEQEPLPWL